MRQPPSDTRRTARLRRLTAGVAALPLMLALAGCSAAGLSGGAGGSLIETADLGASARTIDPSYAVAPEDRAPAERSDQATYIRQAAAIAMRDGKRYGAIAHLSRLAEENPGDKRIAYDLARNLRYVGALTEAETVLNDARAAHPDDALLRLELAKVKLAGGFAAEAMALLKPLGEEHPEDPSILQALGVAYDRTGEHETAQGFYAKAMAHGRPSAALLNNDGLSRLMTGDVDGAIERLRRASTAPGAGPQIRQNLALALTIKGDEAEARKVAEAAAPKAVADQALDYYRTISTTQDAWSLAQDG